ncbi:hypothetical protein NC652_019942 [Populus alba x Populus x berolinensis]|nr:hypothetical protein NC652_019942 [Populus alba x Populus x berolinensis]
MDPNVVLIMNSGQGEISVANEGNNGIWLLLRKKKFGQIWDKEIFCLPLCSIFFALALKKCSILKRLSGEVDLKFPMGTEIGEMKCGNGKFLGSEEFLGFGDFASVNDSAPLQETDSQDSVDLKPSAVSCSLLKKFQKFVSFLLNWMVMDKKTLDSAITFKQRHQYSCFVDRSSDLSEYKKNNVATTQISNQLGQQSNGTSSGSILCSKLQILSTKVYSGHPKLKLSPTDQNIKSNGPKCLFMMVWKCQFLARNLDSTFFRKRRKHKLSSVAKEAGFQLHF